MNQVIINGVPYVPATCAARCCGCKPVVNLSPVIGAKFKITFKSADNSFRGDEFLCVAADDRTVVGQFLTGYWKGQTHVFQRDGVNFFPISTTGLCLCVQECNKSYAVEPTVGAPFQIRLRGDNSYREDVFLCLAADDRTVIGEFLTRKTDSWYSTRTVVFQRDNTEFFLNSPSVVRELIKRK